MTSPPSAPSPLTSVGAGGPGLLIRGVFRVPLENLPRGKDVDEPEVLNQMFLYLATVGRYYRSIPSIYASFS
jgi:hypothetical protein